MDLYRGAVMLAIWLAFPFLEIPNIHLLFDCYWVVIRYFQESVYSSSTKVSLSEHRDHVYT